MEPEVPSGSGVLYFDRTERARIRRALLLYMDENGIGAPKLQELIAEANGLIDRTRRPALDRRDVVAQSTLQRFLAGTHRVNDAAVGLYARFAAPLGDDPVARLGDALLAFISPKAPPEERPGFPAEVFGDYHGEVEPLTPGEWRQPYSVLEVERLSTRPYAAVQETVEAELAADGRTSPGTWRVYEGVMFQPGAGLFALMRDALDDTLRTYSLTRIPDGDPHGAGIVGVGHHNDGALAGPASVKVFFSKMSQRDGREYRLPESHGTPPLPLPIGEGGMGSMTSSARKPKIVAQAGNDGRPPDRTLFAAAYRGDIDGVVAALEAGIDVNAVEPETGLSVLHIAVGTNRLSLTRLLIEEWGVDIKPDGRGRWPTLIAARCRVDEDLCDYIVDAEAKAYYPP